MLRICAFDLNTMFAMHGVISLFEWAENRSNSVFYIKVNKESKLIWSNLIAEASKELPLCIQQITVQVYLMVLAIR